MALTEYYIEADAGAGSVTGAGTEGDPWVGESDAVWSHYRTNATDGSAGNVIHMSNVEEFRFDSALTYPTTANTNPFYMLTWDNGGSSAWTTVGGVSVPCTDIWLDGSGVEIDNPSFTSMVGLRIRRDTSSAGFLIDPAGAPALIGCYLESGSEITTMLVDDTPSTHFVGCHFKKTDTTAGDSVIGLTSNSHVIDCVVEGNCEDIITTISDGQTIHGCLILCGTATDKAIDAGSSASVILTNNTIIGSGVANQVGLDTPSATESRWTIKGNIFQDFDGTGAAAIENTNSNPNYYILDGNLFYNNTTNLSITTPGLELGTITTGTDPLTNTGGNDYSPVDGGAAYQAGFSAVSKNAPNVGADQTDNGTGGGGGGASAHTWAC